MGSLYSTGQEKTLPFNRQLDVLFSEQFKPGDPGAVVLVAKKGEIVYQKAFGSAHLELGIPLDTNHVFKIASVTKQFTAAAILQLMEKNKLSLHDSLQQYIPGFPYKGHTITIEHLLTHSSGIKDYLQIDYQTPYLERRDFVPATIIDSFKHIPLEFAPGTRFSYSNSGYFLLGYIIEKISGQTYQRYIYENLLQPLGLQQTSFEHGSQLIPGRVNGYRKEGTTYHNADYWSMSIAYAAGGLFSTATDLLRWHNRLLSHQLLKKETLEKAWQPYKLANGDTIQYGYGWMLHRSNGIRSIEHGGSFSGFLSLERFFPDDNLFLVILCNSANAPINELALASSEIILGKKMQAAISLPAGIMDSYTGTYRLAIDSQQKIQILKEKNYLVARIGNEESFQLVFETATHFQLKGLPSIRCEFIQEQGRVTKLLVNQNGVFEWKKTEE